VIHASDPLLTEGFHDFEQDNEFRWTNGDAALPASLFEGLDGPMELTLRTGGSTHYPLFDSELARTTTRS
jgi:hypothetical protein